MHEDPDRHTAPSPDDAPASFIAERIREHGPISLAEFMRIALYHPDAGYYRRNRARIGTEPGSDFVTAYNTGGVFADLVAASAIRRLEPARPETFSWVEIGVDRDGSLWREPPKPFRDLRAFGYGEIPDLPSPAVVFSNELFDAQPFHRVRFHGGAWTESGVGLGEDGGFVETPLPDDTPSVAAWRSRLPASAPDKAAIDLPLGAVSLLEELVSPPWHGLFLAFDYGKSWAELGSEHPEGTLRAYTRHRQNPRILAQPGEQDLTGHICWDWMVETLARHGFRDIEVVSQEAFFIRNATAVIERIANRIPGRPDPERQRLQQLIHPAHMGQKFQVLSARRPASPEDPR